MTTYKRGDVVLLLFPNADLRTAKRRLWKQTSQQRPKYGRIKKYKQKSPLSPLKP